MGKEPEWNTAEALLIKEANNAIDAFSRLPESDLCCCVAFSVDHCFGEVVICFETMNNSLIHAKRHEARTVRTWDSVLNGPNGWENAQYYVQRAKLSTHNPQTAEFKYPTFATIRFAEWESYFGNERADGRDPLGHVIVMLHRTISSLVATHSFDRLRMSSPFRVCIEFPRDDLGLLVMRILNWP